MNDMCIAVKEISHKYPDLSFRNVVFNDFKKELIQVNEEKGFNKTVINWLITINLNPFVMYCKIRKNSK